MRESRNDAEEKIGYRGEFARRGLPEKIADRIAGDRSEQRSDRADRRIAESLGTGRSAARREGSEKNSIRRRPAGTAPRRPNGFPTSRVSSCRVFSEGSCRIKRCFASGKFTNNFSNGGIRDRKYAIRPEFFRLVRRSGGWRARNGVSHDDVSGAASRSIRFPVLP